MQTRIYQKKIRTRRLVLVAVMTALSVAGRFIPLVKPVTALTILSGMYLGGGSGFLTGAFAAILSNLYFGQGPWTPFQMLAWGSIGLLAGVMASALKKCRLLLLTYGAVSGLMFSLVMDVWTVLWTYRDFSMQRYVAAMLTAMPFTILYALSNVIFLLLFAKSFGEKMERIHIKYGI